MTSKYSWLQPGFLFLSAHRSIHASGVVQVITTPAAGGEHHGSPFQGAVTQAFQHAKMAGNKHPIIVGAIPFDVTQPSYLYVPQRYEFFDREMMPSPIKYLDTGNTILSTRSIPDESSFKVAIHQAIANFQYSEIKKAVLSRIFEIQLADPVSSEHILANLMAQNPMAYHFRIPMPDGSELVGASPELLLRKVGVRIVSNPLAGSAKRLLDSTQDHATGEALLHSAKDAYEHQIVVDEMREALAPYCLRLHVPTTPSLMSTATMWHLSTPIEGDLTHPGMSVLQLACQLHPTPAVCGYPRGLSRKLIHLIEPFDRGFFTGMVGWCDSEGNGEWVVTIRCGTIRQSTVCLFAGAGIVEASSPEAEWLETQAKLDTMLNAFGLNLETCPS